MSLEDNNNDSNILAKDRNSLYKQSQEYWSSIPATVNGMLGGFEHISDADIEQSQKFLDYFLDVIFQNRIKNFFFQF